MEDSYYEFYDINPKKRKIILTIFFILLLIGGGVFFFYYQKYTLHIKRNLKYEIGSNVSYEIKDYVSNVIEENDKYKINFNGVPIEDGKFNKCGTYTFKITYKNVTKKGKIIIKDTTAPHVTVNDVTIGVGEELVLDDFLKTCDELSKPCTVNLKNSSDENLNKNEGEHVVRLIVKDAYNNETSVSANLIVKSGYDSKKVKKEDLEIYTTDPVLNDFNNQIFIKFNQAYAVEELERMEEYLNFMEESGGDLHKYLSSEYANNRIDEVQIIELYNKYNYVVGMSIRVTLDNKKVFYLTK